ncbi:DUF885 domain-containing protein [Thalassotalea ponticola]|uniref:DUF885 domain-containing protein n=1 Tax=Thalassotalea ponticola TaxID=1523392 RepID=UPI0025B5FB5B|nr:DUF885 domain-containing protein [Thalassotalea ponticola]MDN3651415.1 DUF885 domain-containing protein [Thalassotalea ponticola]
MPPLSYCHRALRMKFIVLFASVTLAGCSDNETVTIDLQEKRNLKLKVEGASQQAKLPPINKVFSRATERHFQLRGQYAQTLNLPAEIDSSMGASFVVDNFEPTITNQYRQFMRAQASLLLKYPPDSEPEQEYNRHAMAHALLLYAGSQQHPQGFVAPEFGHQPYIINHLNSPLLTIGHALSEKFIIRTRDDAKAFLQAAQQIPGQINQVKQKFISDTGSGWIPARELLNQASMSLQQLAFAPANEQHLYRHFIRELEQTQMTDIEKLEWLQQLETLLSEQIQPAYQQVIALINNQNSKQREVAGVWQQPNGMAFYRYIIKDVLNSEFSAEQIHKRSLRQLQQTVDDIDSILVQLGYQQGTVAQRLKALSYEKRFRYPNNNNGYQSLINDGNALVDAMGEQLTGSQSLWKPELFNIVAVSKGQPPHADNDECAMVIRPSTQASSGNGYQIYLNDLANVTQFELPTLLFHQFYPGHQLQQNKMRQLTQLPVLRQIAPFHSYTEGWATYAERLAVQLAMYDNAPFSHLGYLRQSLLRLAGVVVDTGLHAMRWNKIQASNFLAENVGLTQTQAEQLVYRYAVWPGEAVGYYVGLEKIVSLQKQAKQRLGKEFELAEFNQTVVEHGSLPMPILEKSVNDWIASK